MTYVSLRPISITALTSLTQLWPMTFKGRSKGKGMEGYIGHVGSLFKALIISKSAAHSVFTSTQVAIARKPFQCVRSSCNSIRSSQSISFYLPINPSAVLVDFIFNLFA